MASLAVAAQYERRFGRPLITSAIFPQDRRGQPVINPSGKYMVRLTFNGIARKVIVDDLLPVSRDGTLLCSTSSNEAELWVSLVEKAFLKVHGGYDFPGSTSCNDLYMLTGGWIPESVDLKGKGFDAKRTWRRMLTGLAAGDCVLTVATDSSLPAADYDRLGLVSSHAYALLDVREVLGRQLLLLANPWQKHSWTGPYSAGDSKRWTPELQAALKYDAVASAAAMAPDSGVFFIDYDSLLAWYVSKQTACALHSCALLVLIAHRTTAMRASHAAQSSIPVSGACTSPGTRACSHTILFCTTCCPTASARAMTGTTWAGIRSMP